MVNVGCFHREQDLRSFFLLLVTMVVEVVGHSAHDHNEATRVVNDSADPQDSEEHT
jgi:hypothetical protein